MAMIQPLCLFSGIRKNPPTLHREWQVNRRRNSFMNGVSCFNLLSNAVDRRMISEKTIDQVLVFPNQPQQQVLGFDRPTTELAGLVTSEEDHSARSFCVAFKHMRFLVRCILPNYVRST